MINFPTVKLASCVTRVQRFRTSAQSPFGGFKNVYDFGGIRQFDIEFIPADKGEADQLEAFIEQEDTFLFSPVGYTFASGQGSPFITGSNQAGTSIISAGWATSRVVLKAGQWLQIGAQLNRVRADVTSTSSGAATLPLTLPQRSSPANASAIDYASPQGVFRIADTNRASERDTLWANVSITIEEDYG